MDVLSPRRFTVSEYHRMADAGLFADERVELLDGLIVAMPPIGAPHWQRHAKISAYLHERLGNVAFVVPQGSFPLGKRDEPQPDVAILAAALGDGPPRRPSLDEIFAIVEVAHSSLPRDLGPKLRIYGHARIPDYLVVDLEANVLLHHTEPHDLGYRRRERLTRGVTFQLLRLPDAVLEAGAFLA